jgi:hypothetical protein
MFYSLPIEDLVYIIVYFYSLGELHYESRKIKKN